MKIMKKKAWVFLFIFVIILASGGILIARRGLLRDIPKQEAAPESPAVDVVTKKASELKSAIIEERLPGVIVPENETSIVAATSGSIASVSFDVGQSVALGSTLVRINTPFGSAVSKSSVPSNDVRQAEIAVSLAKKSYQNARRLAEKDSTKSTNNSLARDLAKLKLESAEIELDNAIDNSIVKATLAGVISSKNVGIGSSVSPGTVIATIASGGAPKLSFQVSESTRQNLRIGDIVSVLLKNGNTETARITSIGTIADSGTGKFPVEAAMKNKVATAGTIATVLVQTEVTPEAPSALSLPLSAVTTGQDGSFFFIREGDAAKKVPTASIAVSGETAIASADISEDADIIVESNGTIENGTKVSEKK